ncbi:MAG: hypothetical protein LBU51_05480 [Bacteroidales bacterium]|jgi:hypothetical protein|nr:hypothetical protein [Bacteroidales bacterium]
MKKIIISSTFVLSIVAIIALTVFACEKNEEKIHAEKTGSTPPYQSIKVCCYSNETKIYTQGDQSACCNEGGGCLPCLIIVGSPATIDNIFSLKSMDASDVANYFLKVNLDEHPLQILSTEKYTDYLIKLQNGEYKVEAILQGENGFSVICFISVDGKSNRFDIPFFSGK